MKKQKEFSISGYEKKFIVFELTPRIAHQCGDKIFKALKEITVETVQVLLEELVPKTSNLTSEELMDMPFSDLEKIYAIFWEVNASFLKILKGLGVKKKLEEVLAAIQDTEINLNQS